MEIKSDQTNQIRSENALFDLWNEQKKTIHNRLPTVRVIFSEREIWWCSIGKNIGDENNGKNELFERPVIIFRKFGKRLVWIIPLTTQEKSSGDRYFYKFICKDINQNACLSQMRPISTKRLIRFVDTMSPENFQKIRKEIIDLI